MPAGKKKVVFYHSMVCPRCQISKLALRGALRNHPEIEIEKVEFLSNLSRAKSEGVRSIPTLAAGARVLTGIILTRGGIERFFEALAAEPD